MVTKGTVQLVLGMILAASTIWPVLSYVRYMDEVERVKLSLYDETLCPACREFVKSQVGPTWDKVKGIMQVELNAYGWTQETPLGPGYNFTCQHGPEECVGNMVVECAKVHIPQYDFFIQFVVCFMSQSTSPLPPALTVGQKCAESVGTKWSPIQKCANSVEGQQLLHEAGVKFHALKDPEPSWVPWILINDKPNDKAQEDLMSVICSTYQGTPPAECRSA